MKVERPFNYVERLWRVETLEGVLYVSVPAKDGEPTARVEWEAKDPMVIANLRLWGVSTVNLPANGKWWSREDIREIYRRWLLIKE